MDSGAISGFGSAQLPMTASLPMTAQLPLGAAQLQQPAAPTGGELQETFDSFVGETFYSQMLQAMRKTQGKPAYFDGGRAEEVFRNQLDQTLSQELAKNSAGQFTGGMFELFNLQRRA